VLFFGLFLLFFGLFLVTLPFERGLILPFFGLFAIFHLFFVAPSFPPPPGNFSADALGYYDLKILC